MEVNGHERSFAVVSAPPEARAILGELCRVTGLSEPKLVWCDELGGAGGLSGNGSIVIGDLDQMKNAERVAKDLGCSVERARLAALEVAIAHELGHAAMHESGHPDHSEDEVDDWALGMCDRLGWRTNLHDAIVGIVRENRARNLEKRHPYVLEGCGGFLGALSHAQARADLEAAFQQDFGRPGSMRALQFAQAVALGEGGQYGSGCYVNQETGEQSCSTNNWGAAQCRATPPCPSGCIEATDHHADGSAYQACFHSYATPEAGAAAYLRTLYKNFGPGVLASAEAGDYMGAVEEMKSHGYFEAPLATYQAHVNHNVDVVANALGEPRGDFVRTNPRGPGIMVPLLLAAGALGVGIATFPRWRAVVGL